MANAGEIDSHPARLIVKNTTDKTLAAMKESHDAQQINQLVNEIVVQHFDIEQMSKWSLGKEWDKLDESKQALFISNFQQLLVNTYAATLTNFGNNEIDVEHVKQGKNKDIATVPTIVTLANVIPMHINYTMKNKKNDWKVVDISISGVSLVRNYRATYASEIRRHGFDALMDKIITKNELAKI